MIECDRVRYVSIGIRFMSGEVEIKTINKVFTNTFKAEMEIILLSTLVNGYIFKQI